MAFALKRGLLFQSFHCTYNYIYSIYLRIWCLCQNIGHCVGVSSEGVDAGLCPHVPHAGRGVPASSQEDVDGRVEGHAVDTTQVTVVVTDHLHTSKHSTQYTAT